MKKSIRAFGIGLFVAGMCLTLLSKFGFTTPTDTTHYEQQIKELEQQVAALETTKPEQVVETAVEEATVEETETVEETTEEAPKATSSTEEVVTATIFVYEGMSLYEIGQQIEGEGIVVNGREVELYLARPEYSRSIQKGSFDLRSDMTLEQIAKTLTGKKVD